MLGLLHWEEKHGRLRVERERVLELSVLHVGVRPGGRWEQRRLERAASLLRAQGVCRVLKVRGFEHWEMLRRWGLEPVEPLPLYRAMAPALVLAALERSGNSPERATVTLRGAAAKGDLTRTAQLLCPRVRRLIIDAPAGGRELAGRLYWEFGAGVAVGREERTDVCVCFVAKRTGNGNHNKVLPVIPLCKAVYTRLL